MSNEWFCKSTGQQALIALAALAVFSCGSGSTAVSESQPQDSIAEAQRSPPQESGTISTDAQETSNSLNSTTSDIDSGQEATLVVIPVIPDLDGDGIPDNADDDVDGDGVENLADYDDDNDGIEDYADRMRFNPTESLDHDRDGTGDNADTDDDNDGIDDIDDVDPRNQLCSFESDLNSAGQCLIEVLQDELSGAVVDSAKIAYLPYGDTLYRLDLSSRRFLTPIKSTDGSDFTALRHSDLDGKLYIGHSSGLVEYIEGDSAPQKFTELESHVWAIIETPEWLIVREDIWTNLFDKNGQKLDRWAYSSKESKHATWINDKQSLVWFDDSSPWETQVVSRKISSSEDPENLVGQLSYTVKTYPFAIAPDGSALISEKGDLIDGTNLGVTGSLPTEASRIAISGLSWTALNGLIMQSLHWLPRDVPGVSGFTDSFVKVEQLDAEYKSKNTILIEGDPITLLQAGDMYFSIYKRDSGYWIDSYRPE